MTWKDILLNALTTSMFLSVLAFVAKRAVEKWLARNLEKYKVELQSAAFEHQTRFTKLHEQRAAVITELYQRMDRIRQLWEASVRPLRLNVDPEPEQQQNEASRRSLELQEFYFQNKLFLEEELCTAMEDLFRVNWAVLSNVGVASTLDRPGPYSDPAAVASRTMLLKDAQDVIINKLPPVLRRVEAAMRSMLGISEKRK